MEMSVFELLATAREIQGADYVGGDRILCKKRYSKGIGHMLEFQILESQGSYGTPGDYCRLSEEAYRQMREKEQQKRIRIIHHARVKDHTLVYGPDAGRPASKGE